MSDPHSVTSFLPKAGEEVTRIGKWLCKKGINDETNYSLSGGGSSVSFDPIGLRLSLDFKEMVCGPCSTAIIQTYLLSMDLLFTRRSTE